MLEHNRGAGFALASALLFGSSTPLSKVLVGDIHPVLLAAVLYLSSRLGLLPVRLCETLFLKSRPRTTQRLWCQRVVVAWGRHSFRRCDCADSPDGRSHADSGINGFAAVEFGGRSLWKGLVAGSFNLCVTFSIGAIKADPRAIGAASLVGFINYGISNVLFVLALREIGTARTAVYYSTAPFFGALIALIALQEAVTISFLAAAALMGLGVFLHFTERSRGNY
jgi:drug/metabolite transporter (DMT)-like permease